MKYIIYNSAGEILRTGSAPSDEIEQQAQTDKGEFVLVGEEINPNRDSVDPVTKTLVPMGRPPPPPDPNENYPKARAETYPSVQEQMDMLWHAMDSGETPKIEPFYSRIKAVKDAYPKDNSVAPGSVLVYSGE